MSDGTINVTQRTQKPTVSSGTSAIWVDEQNTFHSTDSSGTDVILNNAVAQGRLTLSSACPVTTTDITAASAVYYLPYIGNKLAVYNGSIWQLMTIPSAGIGLDVSGYTGSLCYDIFAYNNSGSLALEGASWSSGSVRSTPLVYQDGVLCKQAVPNITRRYLGTIYMTSAGKTDDSVLRRFCWNYYNRLIKPMVVNNGSTHTYSGGIRKWNNSDTNNLGEMTIGIVDSGIRTYVNSLIKAGADGNYAIIYLYINGEDSSYGGQNGSWNNQNVKITTLNYLLGSFRSGYNYYQVYESSDSASSTFAGMAIFCDFLG